MAVEEHLGEKPVKSWQAQGSSWFGLSRKMFLKFSVPLKGGDRYEQHNHNKRMTNQTACSTRGVGCAALREGMKCKECDR